MPRPPDRRRGPGRVANLHQGPSLENDDTNTASVTDLAARRRPRVCWRCGVEFDKTTPADLARCARLARGAS